MRAILMCMCFLLVSTKANNHHQEKASQSEVSIGKDGSKLEAGFKLIQHVASKNFARLVQTQGLETENVLSSLNEKCANANKDIIQAKKTNMLKKVLSCNYNTIGKNVASLYTDTTAFYATIEANVTYIVTEVMDCVSDSDPVTCFLESLTKLETTVTDIITSSKSYQGQVEALIPKIIKAIQACVNKSSVEYSSFLKTVKKDCAESLPK